MELSLFFDSEIIDGEYDRSYNAEDWARYFRSFIGNGVFANPSSSLQVISDRNDMTILIKQGKGFIDGYFYENTDDLILLVDVADGVLNRMDRVVLRLDFNNRDISVQIKKGNFQSVPVAPSLQRDFDIFELSLATITVNKGVSKITQADVTDTRMDSALCGIVKGVIEQIDVTNLFAQYQSAFEQWFDTVKGTLEGDVAGNLQVQIDDLETEFAKLNEDIVSQFSKYFDKTNTGEQAIEGNVMLRNNKGIGSYTTDNVTSWLLYLGEDNKTWVGNNKIPLVLASNVTPQISIGGVLHNVYHSGTGTINGTVLKATTDVICERYGNTGYFTHANDSKLGTGLLIKNSNGGALNLTNNDWLVYTSKGGANRVVVQINESMGIDGNYRIWWGQESSRPKTGIQFCF